MYTIPADRPLDPITRDIVRDIHDACAALGIAYVLIGARARDILLTHVFGLPIRRATRDVDVAVAVPDWPTFERVMSWLPERRSQWSRSPAIQHRMAYRIAGLQTDVPVDVVPFGGIEDPLATIAWPPDRATIMNVAGFAETLRAAAHVRIAADLVVPVASIAGLAALKLFAWADRHTDDPKDADDLLLLLRGYVDMGNFERLYTDEIGILEACGYDPEIAGGALLGMDVAGLVNTATRAQLLDLLLDQRLRGQLILDMARAGMRMCVAEDNMLTAIDTLLTQFVAGLSSSE